jgi:hypothetical protein
MKRGVLFVLFFGCIVSSMFAQDSFTPLIFGEEVTHTAKMIQQIENELKEVSYLYQSLQNQIQSLKTLKISSFSDFMDFLNGKATAVLSTENRIKSLQVTVNGESYALSDVMGYWDAYTKKLNEIASGKGSDADAAAAYELVGMSQDLITVSKQLKDLTTNAAQKATAIAMQTEKQADTESKRIDSLVAQAQGSQSIVAGLQTSALLEAGIAQDLLELKLQMGSLATDVAAFTADLQRNGLPLARSAQDEAVVGQEIGSPLSDDFFSSK